MKSQFIFLLLAVSMAMCTQGCYYDKEDLLYSSGCDTTNVSFTQNVKPIVNSYCLSCHGSTIYNSLGGNINLDGYSNLLIQVQNGKLLSSINHATGASPMPKNQQKLSDCNIAKIENWITNGATNN